MCVTPSRFECRGTMYLTLDVIRTTDLTKVNKYKL